MNDQTFYIILFLKLMDFSKQIEKSINPLPKIRKFVPVARLHNITELTEECSQYPNTQTSHPKQKKIKKEQQSETSFMTKSFSCLKKFYTNICRQFISNEINIEESQMSELISRLKKKRPAIFLLPQKTDKNKKTLVLDLDETLIYTSFKPTKKYDFKIQLKMRQNQSPFYVKKRFGLDSFLFDLSQLYEIVVFSSGQKRYVESIIDQIDPKNRISYVLSREHCITINKYHYIKNLNALGRNLDSVILIDDNQASGMLNQSNFYKIESFRGSQKDRKLIKLNHFLKYLSTVDDIRPIDKHIKKFQAQTIDLSHQRSQSHSNMAQTESQEQQNVSNSTNQLTGTNLIKQE